MLWDMEGLLDLVYLAYGSFVFLDLTEIFFLLSMSQQKAENCSKSEWIIYFELF